MKKILDDKIVKAKNKLASFVDQQKTSPRNALIALKPEINKLRREGVTVKKIVELLKEEEIFVSISLLRQVVGPSGQKKVKNKEINKNEEKKVTIQKEPVRQQEKPINTTEKTESEKKVEQKAAFKVPDIETLPKSLTSIPNFDPASAKSVEFVDENGDPKIYLEGRIYPGMKKSVGFNMYKPAAEKI